MCNINLGLTCMYGKCLCSFNYNWSLKNKVCVDLNHVQTLTCITVEKEFKCNILNNEKVNQENSITTSTLNNYESFLFVISYYFIWFFLWLLSYKIF